MKIIDLLNMISKGEEVPKFWWNGCIHEVQKEYGTNKYSIFDTYCKKYKKIELEDLNDEIKFLEEEKKIPEKLPYYSMEKIQKAKNKDEWREERISLLEKRVDDLHIKMNDLLDYLKSKGE